MLHFKRRECDILAETWTVKKNQSFSDLSGVREESATTDPDKRISRCKDPPESTKTVQEGNENGLAGGIPYLKLHDERYISYTLY